MTWNVPAGKTMQMTLADVTKLWMNGGSEVQVPVPDVDQQRMSFSTILVEGSVKVTTALYKNHYLCESFPELLNFYIYGSRRRNRQQVFLWQNLEDSLSDSHKPCDGADDRYD